MKIIIYTTSRSDWYQKEADKVSEVFRKKIPDFQIDVVRKYIPEDAVMFWDSDGDHRPSWDWLTSRFPVPEGYDGVGIHITRYLYRRWGVHGIRGAKNTVNKDWPQFWFYANKDEMADGYEDLSQFARLLFHEMGHFFEDLDDAFGDKLNQNSVHLVDYDLKRIQDYPLLIDYRGWILKRKIWHLMNQVINLVRKNI